MFLIAWRFELIRLVGSKASTNESRQICFRSNCRVFTSTCIRPYDRMVDKYEGNRYVKHFSCWNQLLCMLFGQLTPVIALGIWLLPWMHIAASLITLDLGKVLHAATCPRPMNPETVKYLKILPITYHLIAIARKCRNNDDFQIKGKIYAFDSSTIDLCLSVFWWAKFRKNKGGIKLHTLFDITTRIPVFVHITPATMNDVKAMDYLTYEQSAYYIFDRGYIDYTRLFKITLHSAFFVVRAKSNLQFKRMYSLPSDKSNGVLCDQIVKLKGF